MSNTEQSKSTSSNKPLHPIYVTLGGVVIHGAGMGISMMTPVGSLEHLTKPILATTLTGIGAWCDYEDGNRARRYKLESAQGAMLDQIADKTKSASMVTFMACVEPSLFTITAATASIGVDAFSAYRRGMSQFDGIPNAIIDPWSLPRTGHDHQPHKLGKIKAATASVVGTLFIGGYTGLNDLIIKGISFGQENDNAIISTLEKTLEFATDPNNLAFTLICGAGAGLVGALKRKPKANSSVSQ